MKLIAGVLSLSFSFILFTYLIGVARNYSLLFSPGLLLFPFILLTIACYLLHQYYKEEIKK